MTDLDHQALRKVAEEIIRSGNPMELMDEVRLGEAVLALLDELGYFDKYIQCDSCSNLVPKDALCVLEGWNDGVCPACAMLANTRSHRDGIEAENAKLKAELQAKQEELNREWTKLGNWQLERGRIEARLTDQNDTLKARIAELETCEGCGKKPAWIRLCAPCEMGGPR